MSMSAFLVRLYPPAIRQRWGTDIARDVDLSGPRSWFDTAVGAVKLWLHPSDWPETTSGQTRRVLATALVAVLTLAAMLLRAAGPTSLTPNVDHLATSVWLAPILLGLALSTPLSLSHEGAFGRLAAATARTLFGPVLALTALFLLAHSGLVGHPVGATHVLLLTYYWVTLGFVGIHLCLFTARIGRITVMPSTRRLRLALLLIGIGLAFAAVQSLVATVRATLQVGTVVLPCGLAVLAAAVLVASLDLRRNVTGGSSSTIGGPSPL
jgi:hypothetical protein